MSIIKVHSSNLCSVVHRTVNCLTNDNLINNVSPKIDRILPLVPRVESLIKQVQTLSSQLTAKFDKLPKDFQNPDKTEYSQQLKRTAEAVIVTASTIIESQSTIVGGKDGQQPPSSCSGELSEDLRKHKIEEWISHLTISHRERGQEYDIFSELTPDDSVSSIGLNKNKRSQQIDEVGMPGSSLGADKSAGTPTNMSTEKKNSIENVIEEEFTHSSHIAENSSSREMFPRSSEDVNSDTISERALTEYRADHKVNTSYDEKCAKELLAVLGINPEATEWKVNDVLLDLAKMKIGQGVKSSSNILGTLLYLLEKGANVNAVDAMSQTPLYHASRLGNTAVVGLLVKRNADFNIRDKFGRTAWHVATSMGRTPVVEILLKSGVDVEQKTETYRQTALTLAATKGHASTVEFMLKTGASVDAEDSKGRTPLLWASFKGHVGVVETLLKAGASIDARHHEGDTSLYFASSQGHVEVVETLLKAGASIDARDNEAWTPLLWASSEGYVEVVETLLKAGAAFNLKTEDGGTALMFSAHRGHKTITKLLLAAGADIRAKSKYRSTVLHEVLYKHYEDCDSRSCAFCAGSETRQDMVKLLCEKGAHPFAQDRFRNSPLSLVYEEGLYSKSEQKALAKVLKRFGAK